MLAKITSKNQLTLPKAVMTAVGAAEFFDVEVHQGRIVLTPVRIQRGDAVRAKLAALGLAGADVVDAVRWARAGAAGHGVAEPGPGYGQGAGGARKAPAKNKAARGT
ncbi:MAG TPA: AbrB/MazE/SpoVT family DNA-binding domain-containing protein [Burkholderiaceae bacterium]|nr:AbrB/MazE/SpoVT family DNA-binding domain-containing protein [Burkholderiaceae bacterium]